MKTSEKTYEIYVVGEEVDFEFIQAQDIESAIQQARAIVANPSVWAAGVRPFKATVHIRPAHSGKPWSDESTGRVFRAECASMTGLWVPVEERLPEHDVEVLAYYLQDRGSMLVSVWRRKIGWSDASGITTSTPTHWMPLPEPPINH